MKKNIILIILLTITNVVIGQSHKIEILFADNGIEKKLNNDFNIYFVYQDSIQKVIYKPVVCDGNYIMFPSHMPLDKEYKYYILFEYKKKIYYCDYTRLYHFEAFLIHIQKRPFYKYVEWGENEFITLPSYTDLDTNKNIKGEMEIVYGKGDHAATYTRITNFKEYFKKGEELLKLR